MQAKPAGARVGALLSCAEVDGVLTDDTGKVDVRPNTNAKQKIATTTQRRDEQTPCLGSLLDPFNVKSVCARLAKSSVYLVPIGWGLAVQ
jgi:hypothetical protein